MLAVAGRLVEALELSGAPVPGDVKAGFEAAAKSPDDVAAVRMIQEVLDPLCLAVVTINPESRVKAAEGAVKKQLMQQGWRTFLVRVRNEAGIDPRLRVASPNALRMTQQGTCVRERPQAGVYRQMVAVTFFPSSRRGQEKRLAIRPLPHRLMAAIQGLLPLLDAGEILVDAAELHVERVVVPVDRDRGRLPRGRDGRWHDERLRLRG